MFLKPFGHEAHFRMIAVLILKQGCCVSISIKAIDDAEVRRNLVFGWLDRPSA